MVDGATIIVGSLNVQELKASIDALVKHVEQRTQKMASGFDASIEQMKKKLQELSSMKVDMGGSSDGGATRRTRAQNAETQAINENVEARKRQITTLDQEAAAMQRATQTKSARESYYAFVQGYKEQAAQIGVQIREAENAINKAVETRISDLNAKITQAKQKLNELNTELARQKNEAEKTGNFSTYNAGITRTTQSIEYTMKHIEELRRQIAQTPNMFGAQQQEIEQLREKQRQVLNIMRENVAEQKTQATTTQQTAKVAVNSTNQQIDALKNLREAEWQAVQGTRAREQAQRQAAVQGGMAAQQSLKAIAESISTSLAIDYNKPISGIKELEQSLIQMKRAYYSFDSAEKESPIGQSLKRDIEYAEKLKTALLAHNKTLMGIPVRKEDVAIGKEILSYEKLNNHLKVLIGTYQRLGSEERNAARGTELADKIQFLKRRLQEIQQQMNRPISFSAVKGLDANTIDKIIYKMQQLSLYRSGLDVDKQRNEINQVNTEYDRLKKKMDEVMQKNDQMAKSNNALGRSWNYMKNRLAFYFTVGASTQFVKNLIEVRSQYEMNERALGILVDSAERGTQIFNELSQMSLVSPYTLIELSAAARQLTAYDVAAKDVVDTTRRLADMAAAVGIPIERLTYALGQIKAYGYLNSRDARMFSNAGIPLVKKLSEYYTELEGKLVSTADVYDRIKKKSIDYTDVMQVMYKMTDEGGKFFDFQAKMADTLKVRLANLTLAWNNMLNEMGKQTQGILTGSINALKSLFAHWKQIDNVMRNLLWVFGALKVAQFAYLVLGEKMARGLALQATLGKRLTGVLLTLRGAMTTLIANWQLMLGAIAVYAAVDLFRTWSRNTQAIRELNEALAKNAEESAKSIDSFLKTEAMMEARTSALNGKLTVSEGQKTWETIRGEIENSSIASEQLIPKLLEIEDINKRVSEAFTTAEKIRDVEYQLSGLKNELKVDMDTFMHGLFGEGLAEDLEDYTEFREKVDESIEFSARKNRGFWESVGQLAKTAISSVSELFGDSTEEATREANEFAENAAKTIKELIGEEGVRDATKLAEAVARIRKEVMDNSQIRSYGKTLLSNALDEVFSTHFEAYDKTAIVTSQFLDQLQRDYGSTFGNITTDILDKNEKWNKKQEDAFHKTCDKLKKDIPEAWAEILDKMLADLNSRDFTVRVMAKFDVSTLSDLQIDFRKTFINEDTWGNPYSEEQIKENERRFNKLMQKNGESTYEYEERVKKLREDNNKVLATTSALMQKNKDTESAAYKNAKKEHDDAVQWKKDSEVVERWGGYDFTTKKETADARKRQKQAESELQKALKDELSLIEKVRSQYKKLTDVGVSQGTALTMVTNQFSNSIAHINKVLGKNGLPLFNIKAFSGTDNPNKLLAMLKAQLDAAKLAKNIKPSEIKELEVKYGEVVVDAKVYNTKKITDGLNHELSKLKDEYELSVELDANPELGNIFSQALGIDTSELPRTFGDAFEKASDIIRKNMLALGADLGDFDLMSSIIKPDKNNQWMGLDFGSDAVKEVVKWQNEFHEMFKKNITDTEKMLDDYVKKYGDYSDKIAEIESDRLEKVRKLNEAYYTEEMRKRPEYLAKMNAIETGAQREKGQAQWDEFKNSKLYVAMFENLEYVSRATLESIREKLEQLKSEMGTLSPEQLKQVVKQFEKIDQELIRRNPFKGLIKNVKNYAKAIGSEGKKAQQDFLLAQRKYDYQERIVGQLKEELEQRKHIDPLNQAGLETILKQLGIEEEKLKKLKEELGLAEEANEKYNAMRMIFKQQSSEMAAMLQVIAQNMQSLSELRDVLNEMFGVDLGDKLNAVVDDLAKAGEGISKTISSLQSGDFVGATVGVVKTVAGIGDAIASIFGDGAARTRRINREIDASKESVRQLNMAYKDLERAVEKSLGSAETAARRSAIANKEAELSELERQMALEESKRSKDRDDEAVKQYQETIQDLRNEIKDLKEDIVNNLLGSDVKSAAEQFVDTWVEAWRAGETTLDAIEGKMDEMTMNLIKKAASSKIVANILQPLYDAVDSYTLENSMGGVDLTTNELRALASLGSELGIKINEALGVFYGNLENLGIITQNINDGESELSALQAGIQGITEDTAGALEAYMNSVSQQVYYQSDILTQIRDAVVAWDLDVNVATMSQVLLQLQASYQAQQSIQMILEGWSNASGQAIRVEMVS